jgi:hypothetical protein
VRRHGWPSMRRAPGWLLGVAGLLVVAVALPVALWGGGDPAFNRVVGWANVLGCGVAALGLLLVLQDRRATGTGSALNSAADELATQVLRQEGEERARLLGTDRVTPVAANVGFVERLVRFSEVGTGRSGDLDAIEAFYRDAVDGRLVILGEAGSGKTVLAVELVVRLLEAREIVVDPAVRATVPVPVRLSVPAWDVALPLESWLGGQLVARYGMDRGMAAALVEARRVLPVLDGLDEMDASGSEPVRARAAVAGFNGYLRGRGGAPLVVTCREEEYAGLNEMVRPATVVGIRPLTADQIRQYVGREIGNNSDSVGWAGWREVMGRLDDADGWVLSQLRTPWRLTLAVAYGRDEGDLTALLPTAAELSAKVASPDGGGGYPIRVAELLLGRFVAARVRVYGGDRYQDPVRVERWLRVVAEHLRWQERQGLSGTDVVLHEWWRAAGQQRVRRWHAWIAAAVVSAGLGVVGIVRNGGVAESVRKSTEYLAGFPMLDRGLLIPGTILLLALVGLPILAWRTGNAEQVSAPEVNFQQLRTRQGRRRLASALVDGLASTLVAALVLGLIIGFLVEFQGGFAIGALGGFAGGFVGGFVGGLTSDLVRGLRRVGATSLDPRDPLRNDLTVLLGFGFESGLLGGFVFVFVFRFGVAFGFAAGCVLGLVGGLALGITGNSWLRYVIAVVLIAHHQSMPIRFAGFLAWAYRSGLLRVAGDSYQFRHVELRDRLLVDGAAAVEPASTPACTPTAVEIGRTPEQPA